MLKEAAVKEFWDEELGMFVSGPDRQGFLGNPDLDDSGPCL